MATAWLRKTAPLVPAAFAIACCAAGMAQDKTKDKDAAPAAHTVAAPDSATEGTVTIGGQAIAYKAIAGTITVGATDAQDATLAANGSILPDSGVKPVTDPNEAPATARMFYVAYFKKDAVASHRPLMFLYNGGPGSATMWLHLGTFGPRRVVVPDTKHQEGAPYSVVENQYSLLDVCDLVFIDAPGTGLSRTFGKEKAKAFYGIDADGHAFARFIQRFLSK